MATGYPFYNALVPLPDDVAAELASIRTALGQLPPAAYANEIAAMTASCSGSGNVYALSMTRSPTAYSNSMFITFTPSSTITGAVTVNVNGLGAVALVQGDGRPMVANDISPAHDVNIIYSDAQRVFYLISQNESINSATAASISTVTGDVTSLANQTIKYRSTGAPTNNPSPLSASITDNTIGGRDVQLNWNGYTQGTLQADGLLLFFRPGSGTPAVTDASIQFNVTSTASYHLFQNIDMQAYCAGIAAFRRTENALEIGAIQTIPSWSVAAGTIDNRPSAGTVNGATIVTGAVTADKTNIAAINAGTGGINPGMVDSAQLVNLAVSELKLAAGAVSAAKTSLAAIDPLSGSLAINSVIANNIVGGTITGDKIFAGTITSDHITVSTLSAITANLGTVNAGSITGSANISIAGSAVFNGAYSVSGHTFATVCNPSGGQQGGVWGYGINYGGYFIGAGDGSVGMAASCNGVNGTGVYGSAGLGGKGVGAYGVSNATALYASADSGIGVHAISATGVALKVAGSMEISNAGMVTNLNADMVDGYHASQMLFKEANGGLNLTESSGNGLYSVNSGGSNSDVAVYGNCTNNGRGGWFKSVNYVGIEANSTNSWGVSCSGGLGGFYTYSPNGIGTKSDTGTGMASQFIANNYSGIGCSVNNVGGGAALAIGYGDMTTNSTTLVVNLNADKLDGLHANSLCQKINTQSGTAYCYPSDGSFWITSYVSGVTTRLLGTNEINFYTSSDARIKHDIRKETLGLDFINKLKPKTYRLNIQPGRLVHGFIAQDVKKLIEPGRGDVLFEEHENGVLGTDYVAMIAPLVKAVQELSKRVKELETLSRC